MSCTSAISNDRQVHTNSFQDPTRNVVVGQVYTDSDDIAIKFEQAQRFIEDHWTRFDDPAGVAADIAELRRAVAGAGSANPIRTRLTLHRLNRTCGSAPPEAAVITVVREVLGT
jgi:hypothetical protein